MRMREGCSDGCCSDLTVAARGAGIGIGGHEARFYVRFGSRTTHRGPVTLAVVSKMSVWRRIGIGVAAVLAVVLVVGAVTLFTVSRRALPAHAGEFRIDGLNAEAQGIDRKSVVQGRRVSVRGDHGGRRIVKKKKHRK